MFISAAAPLDPDPLSQSPNDHYAPMCQLYQKVWIQDARVYQSAYEEQRHCKDQMQYDEASTALYAGYALFDATCLYRVLRVLICAVQRRAHVDAGEVEQRL